MHNAIRREAVRFSILTALAGTAITACGPTLTDPQRPLASNPQSVPPPYAVIDGEAVPVPEIEMGDPQTIAAILDEGTHRNRVMDHLDQLCVQIGPRLTASTALEDANRWTADQFESWGLQNVELQEWDSATLRFDRGPSTGRIVEASGEAGDEIAEIRSLEFTTLSWAPGTDGPLRGPVVRMPTTLAELDAVSDQLTGSWVLIGQNAMGREGIRGIGRAMAARHVQNAEFRQMIERGETVARPDVDARPDDGITGDWSGTASGPAIPGDGTEFIMSLVLQPNGTVTGTAGLPALGFNEQIIEGSFADGILSYIWPTPIGDRPMSFAVRGGSVDVQMPDEGGNGVYTFAADLEPVEAADPQAIERFIAFSVIQSEPAGFLSSSRDERVWTTSVKRGEDLLRMTRADVGQDVEVNIRDSDYRWINSDLADGREVTVEFDLPHSFEDGPIPLYNTIAEIP
ncbi:MAG: hypothetical protein AAFR96_03410, partial [Planctomycetota bacterium]